MSKRPQSVLSFTPETVAGMSPAELRRIAVLDIRHLLEDYQETGRARSWAGTLVFGLLLPHVTGTAKDLGAGCLNILIPFLGPGYLVSGSYILWVLQLLFCVGLPFFIWPGYEEFWCALGISYAVAVAFNLLSVFVLKKIAFILRWLRLANKVRRGLTGLHAGTKELAHPFFAKETEFAAFCADLDTREAHYRRLQESLRHPDLLPVPRPQE